MLALIRAGIALTGLADEPERGSLRNRDRSALRLRRRPIGEQGPQFTATSVQTVYRLVSTGASRIEVNKLVRLVKLDLTFKVNGPLGRIWINKSPLIFRRVGLASSG